MIPTNVISTVLSKEKVSSRVYLLSVQHIKPVNVDFLPGQYISLQVSAEAYRNYAICSDTSTKTGISLVISAEHEGLGANYIRNLSVGDVVNFVGPEGKFLLPEKLEDNVIFLATGTGISPFITFLYRFSETNYTGKIHLFFGVRNESELFFSNKLEEFKTKLSNFDYTVCFSEQGRRVTDTISEEIDTHAQYFLSGNPSMIDDAVNILQAKGIPDSNVFFEKFFNTNQR